MPVLSSIPDAQAPARTAICEVVEAVVGAIEPGRVVGGRFCVSEGELQAGDYRRELTQDTDIFVVGAGKASVGMARAVEQQLAGRIDRGMVVAPRGADGGIDDLNCIEVAYGSHPTPDDSGADAARRLLDIAGQAGANDLVVALISGGGSSLATLPAPGLGIDDLTRTNEVLLESAMDIRKVNTIRKHLSAIAGGKLAEAIGEADALTLVLSDVIGNPLDVIASGPTVPDPTTYDDALGLAEAFELNHQLPARVVEHLREGAAGELEETPGPDAPCFEGAEAVVVGDNELAARAAANEASRLGWNTSILSTYLEGEAREVARVVVALAKEVLHHNRPVEPPACLILGGETTVTVRGDGRGGRNKELALAALAGLEGEPSITVGCFGTDGIDGPTDSAGAIADRFTWRRACRRQLDPIEFLDDNHSQSFFEATGDLLVTGPTGSNVNDLVLVFVEATGPG